MDSPEPAPHLSAPHVTEDEPPPLLRTWGRVYTLVVFYLAVLVALFYVFSRAFAP